MWMVGYKDGGEFNMSADSFHGRKLRPLIPRPMTSNNSASPTTTPSLDIFRGADFFSHYHNMSVTEQGKMRDHQLNNQPVAVSSSRWNPTPEQLSALEELYHKGTRTPSAEQIQHITAQLRRFGKIEGKNVFYWFQNHKARERQKRRRQMESSADQGNHQDSVDNITEKNDLTEIVKKKIEGGGNRTMFEEQNKNNWVPSTNCSSTLEQESFSTQRTAKAAVAECRTDGWIQFDEGELQQRRNFAERNATWHMMQLSCPPPPSVPANHHFINTLTAAATSCSSPTITTSTVTTARPMDPKLIKAHHDLSFFKAPYRDNIGVIRLNCFHDIIDQDNCVESQTLQLFPLRSEETDDDKESSEPSASAALMNANFNGTPSQFYEFLPLKN